MKTGKAKNRVILIIRDGWGYSKETKGNAVKAANVPNNNYYEKNFPMAILKCSGNAVGLPEGTQGGSEAGHITIGAGRIVWQPLELINRQIKSGKFFKNQALLSAINNCKKNNSALHLMGLFSDEGIHGTTQHLYALLELAEKNKIEKVFVHAFLDGRDVPEKSAKKYFLEFAEKSSKIGVGKIATIVGRYYAMDRDGNYGRTEKAYRLLTLGEGEKETNPLKAIENAYAKGDKTDYYVRPIAIVGPEGEPIATIKNKDSIVFWNFRSDRTRQLAYAFVKNDFSGFKREKKLEIVFVCMSRYDEKLGLPVAFEQEKLDTNLGLALSKAGLKQLRIAETEKYAHVTFFFNSQAETAYRGEDRILVPSPKVPSYAEKPEMSAFEITEKVLPEIEKEKYDFVAINFANGDLVGHSANFEAGIKACEAVDKCIGKIIKRGLEKNYTCIITGDHGNIESMFYPNGEPKPSHGTNPVPFLLISNDKKLRNARLGKGGLSDIESTILDLMGLKKPKEMTGKSLIKQ
ncbi:MAG: 2,3-bisphosphoglycerate-independent phosphoglycerate mutase [Candidatus ainarchaeum sp.]|nr:2,3-bisphosphoglycerate-independent phosphoglycerate mutase [Candidatus ainarchaeum sp.]